MMGKTKVVRLANFDPTNLAVDVDWALTSDIAKGTAVVIVPDGIVKPANGRIPRDWLAQGVVGVDNDGSYAHIKKIAKAKPADPRPQKSDDEEEEEKPKEPQATMLLWIAEANYRFGRTPSGEPFAVLKDGPNVMLPLKGNESLRAQLARRFFDKYEHMPSQAALASVMLHLLALCDDADEPEQAFLRVGTDGPNTVLDLGDASGSCIVISRVGWVVRERSPILFRRTGASLALPTPVRSENGLDAYRKLFNVSTESWPLVLAYLVSTFYPDIAHPIMLLSGEQGSAKTTTARGIVMVVDPCEAPVRAGPRNLDDWQVAAFASYIVALDNLSAIDEKLSDALCRASTGDGLVKRKLYTDKDVVLLSFRRMVIITAIELGSLRGDLGDRLLVIELDNIDEKKRRKDAELDAAFNATHPAALAALLDLVVKVKAIIAKGTGLKELPRMADFGELLFALDQINGTKSLDAYKAQSLDMAREVSDADNVTRAVRAFVGRGSQTITATHLYDRLTVVPDKSNNFKKPPRDWPANPQVLAGRLKRIAPALRKLGVDIEFVREGHDGKRAIKFTANTAIMDRLDEPIRNDGDEFVPDEDDE